MIFAFILDKEVAQVRGQKLRQPGNLWTGTLNLYLRQFVPVSGPRRAQGTQAQMGPGSGLPAIIKSEQRQSKLTGAVVACKRFIFHTVSVVSKENSGFNTWRGAKFDCNLAGCRRREWRRKYHRDYIPTSSSLK